jgi:hypothetical protein
MALIKPLIKSELLGLLHFTTTGPEAFYDLEILPEVIEYFVLYNK